MLDPSTLYRYLQLHCLGLGRATRVRDLAAVFGVRETLVRQLVHELRAQGNLIGSSSIGRDRGYFIPICRTEALAGIHHLLTRLRSLREVYEPQLAALQRQFGEPTLFDAPIPPA